MESWRKAWREGIAPQLSIAGLERLRQHLEEGGRLLLQGATTHPPAYTANLDLPVECCCPIGTALLTNGATVRDIINQFSDVCDSASWRLGEQSACRYFLNWWDENNKQLVVTELLAEINL